MREIELLHIIQPVWLHRALQKLARGASVREDLNNQLTRFFVLLEQVMETGDPAWLDTLLLEWTTSLTQTDLESGPVNLTQFIRELTLITFSVCRENLDEKQALDLMESLMPYLYYAMEKVAFYEMQARVNYVSNQLRQVRQQLERLDRSKSDFIAVAAHELKTPLTLIEGYTAMLREIAAHSDNSSEAALIDGINNGTRRLKGIVDDMIDVSLIDNNLLTLNFQPVWLNRMFITLKHEIEPTIEQRQLELTINDFPGFGEITYGDPERLMQVFRNVLMNAIKYTPDRGKIVVDGRKLPGFVEITINDTGIGIDPDDQSFIFEKFTRIGNASLHSSGKTKFKGGGPGLGLHISKGIIEAHGGAIWAESEGYDEKTFPGSTFHILVPLRSDTPDAKTAKLFAALAQPNPPKEA